MGTLYYGDNLDILRRYLKDETVDLVYLDPPFNSAQNYNAFFHEKDGTDAASQIHACEDTWQWDIETKKAYDAITPVFKVARMHAVTEAMIGLFYMAVMISRLVSVYSSAPPASEAAGQNKPAGSGAETKTTCFCPAYHRGWT